MSNKVWDFIKGVAPSLAGLAIGGPFAPIASMMISKAVGAVDNTENSIQAAITALGSENATNALQAAESNNADELALMVAENARLQMQETHKTARAEINSDDAYVRGWRPAFGYAVRTCFLIQVGGSSLIVLIAIIAEAMTGLENGSTVTIIRAIAAMIGATSIIWGFALSILGVNIHSRSQDKAIQAGQDINAQPGLVTSLIQKFVK